MEDKFVVTVPSRFYASPIQNSLAVNRTVGGDFFGAGVSGGQAFANNLMQFMLGAPVVDYNSIAVTLGDNPSATASLEVLETSVTRADSVTRPAISTASAYSNFSDRLYQNLDADTRSSASGYYAIVLKQNHFEIYNASGQLRDSGGAALNASYGTSSPDAAVTHDFYDSSGNFVFCVGVMDATGFGTGSGDYIGVSVDQPEYTEAYNWGEVTRTSRTDARRNNSAHSVLFFDGKRGSTTDPTDPLSDYDMQGISFIPWNAEILTMPAVTIDVNQTICSGGFWAANAYYPTGNSIFSAMDAGRAFSSAGATSSFNPNKFTLIRGHGYVRILGQVADMPSGTVNATYSERDDCFFLGMFNPYETMEDYPHPMAFFGKVGGSASQTGDNAVRPFWRASRGRVDLPEDDIWALSQRVSGMQINGQFTAMMPFILSRQFRIESTPSGTYNLPVYTKMLLPGAGKVPLLDVIDTDAAGLAHSANFQGVTNVATYNIGTYHDGKRHIAIGFEGPYEATGWDPVIGWEAPSAGIGPWMANPGGTPNIEPLRITQAAGDHHTWTYQDGTSITPSEHNRPTSTLLPSIPAVSSASVAVYENIGRLPGLYWGPEIDYIANTGAVTYPSGSEFTINNRTYRMVIGHSNNSSTHFNVVDGRGVFNYGNLYFDLNAL